MIDLKMIDLKKVAESLNVLYVEDDEESREQISEIFKLIFDNVDVAFDGEDAFAKYKLQVYDIVITDINMPRMDGLTLSKKIKALKPLQSIVILSAYNQAKYLVDAIELGVDGFLMKPMQVEQFSNVLFKVSNMIFAEKLSKDYRQKLEQKLLKKTQELEHNFMTDKETSLLNKTALVENLSKDSGKILLLLSIDSFESLYITYGHINSMRIIIEVANYLKKQIPNKATLYRSGNHKFSILTTQHSLNEMLEIAKLLQNDIALHSIYINDHPLKITVSIGVSEGDLNLFENSYIALKEAQKLGKNHIKVYTKDSSIELYQQKIQKYLPLLRDAVSHSFICPYYQAIRNNKTQKIEKYECLARIVTLDGRVESPSNFIDIAELTGMIPEITKVMIEKSFAFFQNNSYEFSINISEYDLNDGYLQNFLAQASKKYAINPSRVVLEVLEGVSVLGAKQSLEQLMQLKEEGYQIAIDDFGAQNSNFERVHFMKVDYIKIDGVFIKNMNENPKSYYITKTITDFAKSIGAKVIAEFVHSKEIQDIVMDLNIDYSQGYYFSEPSRILLEKSN